MSKRKNKKSGAVTASPFKDLNREIARYCQARGIVNQDPLDFYQPSQIPFSAFVAAAAFWPRWGPEVVFRSSWEEALIGAAQNLDVEQIETAVGMGAIPASLGYQLIYLNIRQCQEGHFYYQVGFTTDWDDKRGVVMKVCNLRDWKSRYPANGVKPLPSFNVPNHIQDQPINLRF